MSGRRLMVILMIGCFLSGGIALAQAAKVKAAFPSEMPDTFVPTNDGFDHERREVEIPMRDGVKLHTVILVPKGAKDAPMLLTRTPYNADNLTTHLDSSQLASNLYGYDNATDVIIEGGYIRVVQDVRGKYGSDYILELQGFIFFGTANAVLERIKSYLETAHLHAVNFILLDFRRVTGLDSSAVFSFKKALQLSETQTFILVLTGISEKIRLQLTRSDLFADPTRVLTFRDLDHGLENCENELLRRHDMENMNMVISISQQLAAGGFKHADPDRILNYLESLQVKRGERLIQQGDPADSLYFIEDGTLSVQLEMGEGKQVRLKTLSSAQLSARKAASPYVRPTAR